jgi:protein-arginine kinase activator protein McsA
MKRCTICKEEFSLSFFNMNRSKKDGLSDVCRECNKKHSRAYYKANHSKHLKAVRAINRKRVAASREKLRTWQQEHPCVDCGESDTVVLELDHVRGKKLKHVTKMIAQGYGWHAISVEIGKCESRCANCHRRKTAQEFHWAK